MKLEILLLTVSSVVGVALAGLIALRLRRILNFRSLLLLNFVLVYPVSGVVHLARVRGASRGYVDIAFAHDPALATATLATSAAALGLYPTALVGLKRSRSYHPDAGDWLRLSERRLLLIAIAVLLPISLWAGAKVTAYVATLSQSRVIGLSDGLARFSFLSNWFVWAVAFGAIVVLARARSTIVSLAVLSGSSMMIAGSVAWSGGRSILLVLLLPLLVVILDRLRGPKLVPLIVGGVALLYWSAAITQQRQRDQRTEIGSWASSLDWQWGRFSMFGFADRHLSSFSTVQGETFVASAASVVNSITKLLGVQLIDPVARPSVAIAGQDLLGNPNRRYIVPGLGPELLLNFGVLGVFIGFACLGLAVAWVDGRYARASSAVSALSWAYIGSLLVLRTLTSESETFWIFLIFTGAPLLVVWGLSAYMRRRQGCQVEEGVALEISPATSSHR